MVEEWRTYRRWPDYEVSSMGWIRRITENWNSRWPKGRITTGYEGLKYTEVSGSVVIQ